MVTIDCPCCGEPLSFSVTESEEDVSEGSDLDLEALVREMRQDDAEAPQTVEEMRSYNDPEAW